MEKEDSMETSRVDSPASSRDGTTTNHHKEGSGFEIMEKEHSLVTSSVDSPGSSQDGNTTNQTDDFFVTSSVASPASSQDGDSTNHHEEGGGLEIMENEYSMEASSVDSPASSQDGNITNRHKKGLEILEKESLVTSSQESPASSQDGNTINHHKDGGSLKILEKEDNLVTSSEDSPASSQDGNTTNHHKEGGSFKILEKEDSLVASSLDSPASSQDGDSTNHHEEGGGLEIMENEFSTEASSVDSPASSQDGNITNHHKKGGRLEILEKESLVTSSQESPASSQDGNTINHHKDGGSLKILEKEDNLVTSSEDSPASSQDGNTTNHHKEGGSFKILEKEDSLVASSLDSPASSQDGDSTNHHEEGGGLEIMENEFSTEASSVDSPASSQDGNITNHHKKGGGLEILEKESFVTSSQESPASSQDGNTINHHKDGGSLKILEKEDNLVTSSENSPASSQDGNTTNHHKEGGSFKISEKEDSLVASSLDSPASSQDGDSTNHHEEGGGLEIMENEYSMEASSVDSPASSQDGNITNHHKEGGGLEIMQKEDSLVTNSLDSPASSQDGNTTNQHKEGGDLEIIEKEDSLVTSCVDPPASSQDGNTTNQHKEVGDLEIMKKEDSLVTSSMDSPASSQDGNTTNHHKEGDSLEILEKEDNLVTSSVDSPASSQDGNTTNHHKEGGDDSLETSRVNSPASSKDGNTTNHHKESSGLESKTHRTDLDIPKIVIPGEKTRGESLETNLMVQHPRIAIDTDVVDERVADTNTKFQKLGSSFSSVNENEIHTPKIEEASHEDKNPCEVQKTNFPPSDTEVYTNKNKEDDGTEIPEMEPKRSSSCQSLENDSVDRSSLFPDKAVAITNFMRVKSAVAVSSVLRHLSMKGYDEKDVPEEGMKSISNADSKEVSNSPKDDNLRGTSPKNYERSGWNPLSFIGISLDNGPNNKAEQLEDTNKLVEPIPMKGRILLYTRLGCSDCNEARIFLHLRGLRFVEINIDVYPSRKSELEKFSGSSAVPKVFFNEVLIGGLNELNELEESGRLKEKIEYVTSEMPSFEAPLPPLSGEDDVSSSGSIDELALIVRNMKSRIVVKDRFYKMRRITNAFLGSEAVDFLSKDQYLEREEAVQFGRKLAQYLFFLHVFEENVFEDGNGVYRFLDDDPLISQCQNIPRGIIEVKPKSITDISLRLRFMSSAIFDAYTSKNGNHVDYRSIHGSEEFARYLRIVEELQRVNLHGMPREEKLAFFINLYNMMAIHAILVWGHPAGALERKKLFGEFKYVIGGCTYSLSDIQNGILRGNQRTPYTLTKTFGGKDKRSTVALSYLEPLVHFALVYGTRSGPALRCYSSKDIDKELMEAAHRFIRSGGLTVDLNTKIASLNKILKWFRSDFGKNENEVLKHAANYLEPLESQAVLELIDETQLKVVYKPYDWGLNN